MFTKNTWFISSGIIVVLEFLIKLIERKERPFSQSIGHIDKLDTHITFRDKEYEIREDIPYRFQEYIYEFRRGACIGFSPHTSPESFRTSDDDTCITTEHTDNLVCHLFSDNMLKWLYVDVS